MVQGSFFIWIKDLLSDIIPFMLIIAWSAMVAGCFPDMWGRLTLLGIFVVTIFIFFGVLVRVKHIYLHMLNSVYFQ